MNRPLFSHVPFAMASCPRLLACQSLYRKNTLLEEYTFPCAQGRFSKTILTTTKSNKFTCAARGNPTIALQPWVAENTLANLLEPAPPTGTIGGSWFRCNLWDWDSTCLVQRLCSAWAELEAAPHLCTGTPESNCFGSQPCLTEVKWKFTNFNYYRV